MESSTPPLHQRRTLVYDGGVARNGWLFAIVLPGCLAGCRAKVARSGLDASTISTYDRYRQPERLLAALGLEPGQRVADVGAGSGYLTFRIAEAVGPSGRVVATDVDDRALAALRARRPLLSNVVVRKVRAGDPGLEAGAFDLVLLSEVDQYLPNRVDYLRKLRAALAPGGRVAVTNRQVYRAPLVAAATRAGYLVASESDALPAQYLVLLAPDVR